MKQDKFDIQGMTCSSCQAHVEKAVKKLEGVNIVNVNLLTNNMNVEYDETQVSSDRIIKAVVDAGYGARLDVEDNKASNRNKETLNNNDEIKNMKKRLILSILFLIPLMYLAMHQMFYNHFGIPVPEFIKNIFHGRENALIFSFTQFLLVIPIMYINRNYYIKGFKSLFKMSPNMDSLIALRIRSCCIIWCVCNLYDRIWFRT